jgi:small-conductance mechanosensitive channel
MKVLEAAVHKAAYSNVVTVPIPVYERMKRVIEDVVREEEQTHDALIKKVRERDEVIRDLKENTSALEKSISSKDNTIDILRILLKVTVQTSNEKNAAIRDLSRALAISEHDLSYRKGGFQKAAITAARKALIAHKKIIIEVNQLNEKTTEEARG